ncbi:MAG: Stk1 family PASTA domain-containing Ser/Thr kinase [Sciscionella sp.]
MTTPELLSNRYELGETLGYGGMSEVHKGRDVRLGRDVAVKVLRADLARDPQFQERFRREAQNAAALNHPAIVAVYDTGETQTEYGPLPYIVMEYVEGKTLRDIVKTEGPISGKRAMEIMADVCAALDFSHRNGIVHRDVKPANVMITQTGAVKVMDFGIARALNDGQAAVTQTSAVIGTAQYLSPEQARGESVDARSDVYSAGCVLYELITGEPPFTGDSPVAVAYQHVREDPHAPSSVHSTVLPALDAIVLKALAKNPANRYQSAAEMRSDLVRVLSGQRPSAPAVFTDEDRTSIMTGSQPAIAAADDEDYDPEYEEEQRAKRRKRWITAAIVAACVIVIALAAWITTSLMGSNPNSKTVAVPSGLVGQTQSAATQALAKENLKPNIKPVYCQPDITNNKPPPCDPDTQVGKVIRTAPGEGAQVAPLSTVTLYIGQSPQQVAVPDLKGMSLANATNALKAQDLAIGQNPTMKETTDSSLVGKVISSDPPKGGQLNKGGTVNVTVGKQAPMVTLSNFKGQKYADAAANIQGLGLNVQRKDVDSSAPADTVINQNPSSGQVPKGSTVTLTVSKGNKMTMPSLQGQTPDQAQQTLASQGWNGSIQQVSQPTTDLSQVGKVVNSNPQAGQSMTKDQTVTIYVGQFGAPTSSSSPPTG